MRQSAMFFFSTGERVPDVTTPTCERPTWTQSPWPAVSLPSSSSPTRRALRVRAPLGERLAADEVVLLVRGAR